MRLVFFGTPDLAVPVLAAAAESHEVAAVITQPDRPQGRSSRPEPPPVKKWALEHNLPVHQPEKLHNGAFEDRLRSLKPQVCVVAAYGRLLRQPVLDVPESGWLNMHPSLLPRWRGPSPIQTALLEGDMETGVSIMRMTLEMDAGDVVLQESTPIHTLETAGELSDRLAVIGARLMCRALDLTKRDAASSIPQDPSRVTYSRLFEKTHGRIRWAEDGRHIHNRIRACNPWPVAQCLFRGQVCRILRSEPVDSAREGACGEVIGVLRDRIVVATGRGGLAVLCMQLPGKKALGLEAFLRGTPIREGDRFEDLF